MDIFNLNTYCLQLQNSTKPKTQNSIEQKQNDKNIYKGILETSSWTQYNAIVAATINQETRANSVMLNLAAPRHGRVLQTEACVSFNRTCSVNLPCCKVSWTLTLFKSHITRLDTFYVEIWTNHNRRNLLCTQRRRQSLTAAEPKSWCNYTPDRLKRRHWPK